MLDEDTGTVFRDVITLALAGFIAALILLLPWINPPAQPGAAEVDAPGDIMFEASWPNELDTDVDLWIQGPSEPPVGYSNKGATSCNLLRDDLGHQADPLEINHEVTTCRGILTKDEYVMNLHLYRDNSNRTPIPVNVKVAVRKPNGTVQEVLHSRVGLKEAGREITVVRFRLNKGGELVSDSVHSLYKPLRSQGVSGKS